MCVRFREAAMMPWMSAIGSSSPPPSSWWASLHEQTSNGRSPVVFADARTRCHHVYMNTRLALISLSKRVLTGDEITTDELSAVIPDPVELDQLERLAWQRLSRWADDDDIRLTDEAYAEMRRRQIADALRDLEALEAGYDSSEIALGDHQATHIPLLGCLAVVLTLAALLYAMFAHGFFMHGDGQLTAPFALTSANPTIANRFPRQ